MSVNCFSHCHRCSLCAMNKLSLNYSSFAEGTELCTDKNTKRFFSSWPRAFLSSLFPRCWKVEWTSDDSSIIVTPPSSEHPFMSTIPFLASSHAFFVNENENCAYAVLCSQCFSRFVWLLSVFFFLRWQRFPCHCHCPDSGTDTDTDTRRRIQKYSL